MESCRDFLPTFLIASSAERPASESRPARWPHARSLIERRPPAGPTRPRSCTPYNLGLATPAAIDAVIARRQHASSTERANYQLFLTELCELLALPRPEPAREGYEDNAYGLERRVDFRHGDSSESRGFIDLYRRGAFVCEAKQTWQTLGCGRWDDAMLRARGQAEAYASALPATEGRLPFLVVTDVGRSLDGFRSMAPPACGAFPCPMPAGLRGFLIRPAQSHSTNRRPRAPARTRRP